MKPFDPYRDARARGDISADRRTGATTRMLLRALLPASEHRTVVLMAENYRLSDTLRKDLLRMARALNLVVDPARVLGIPLKDWYDRAAMSGRHWVDDDVSIFVDHTAGGYQEAHIAYVTAVARGIIYITDFLSRQHCEMEAAENPRP